MNGGQGTLLSGTHTTADSCGTTAGYVRHRKLAEAPCADCRRAQATYMRQYRKRNRAYVESQADLNAARSRAMTRLARLHPAQFEALMDEELSR